jgi:putative ABC transport system substrate-binding protein
MIERRDFITLLGGAAAWPLAARAQQGELVRRVGVLTSGADTVEVTTRWRDELEKLGWMEGRDLRLDIRFGTGDAVQTGALAADLVQLSPDVIVATYLVALRAVQQQTKTIPIVFLGSGDPVGTGRVRNPAHPEGNATGIASAFGSLGGKWLELLKEVAPNITRVLHMYPVVANLRATYLDSVEAAAQSLRVQIVAVPVSDADAMKAAIESFAAEPNGGLLPSPAIIILAPLELTRLAAQYRLPAIYGDSRLPAIGGLMSYSSDLDELVRGSAVFFPISGMISVTVPTDDGHHVEVGIIGSESLSYLSTRRACSLWRRRR